jgi:hypothetical protein
VTEFVLECRHCGNKAPMGVLVRKSSVEEHEDDRDPRFPLQWDLSLNTGQCHWRDQLAPSLPQSGLKLPFFFSFALALHADEARYAGNASLAGI